MSERLRWTAVPAAFVLGLSFGDYTLVPVSLSAPLALLHPELLGLSRWFGVASLEFILVASSVLLVRLWELPALRRWHAMWLLVLASCVVAGRWIPVPHSQRELKVALVQPAVSSAQLRAARWTPSARRRLVRRLDRLTQQAVTEGADVVLWPEGGNLLPNRRLAKRRTLLSALAKRSGSELWVGGYDFDAHGRSVNVIDRVTSGGFGTAFRKAHPVPIAEHSIAAGHAQVAHTPRGVLGVAICFDSLFARHWTALARQGAQAAFVASDTSSFGDSYVSHWHAAHTILRAASLSRPLAFVSNRGPTVFADAAGNVLEATWRAELPAVHTRALPLAAPVSVGLLWLHKLVPLASVLLFAGVFMRRRFAGGLPSAAKPMGKAPLAGAVTTCVMMVVVAVAAGAVLAVSVTASAVGKSIVRVVDDLRERAAEPAVLDGYAPAFRQHTESSCGASALAFGLTMLGDDVFEEDFLELEAPPAVGYSFSQLAAFARSRGFDAEGLESGADALPKLGQPPAIAHFRAGHFVTVVGCEHDVVFFFDPGQGRTLSLDVQDFARLWSGRLLRLRPASGSSRAYATRGLAAK